MTNYTGKTVAEAKTILTEVNNGTRSMNAAQLRELTLNLQNGFDAPSKKGNI
jgi:hypothetical protein